MLKTSIRSRFIFTVGTNFFRSLLSFITGILLARLLGPESYGNMAFLMGSFMGVLSLLNMGSSSAFFTFMSQKTRSRKFVLLFFCNDFEEWCKKYNVQINENSIYYKKNNNEYDIKPNYNFDLCRLGITILDEINYEKDIDYKNKQYIIDFIYSFTLGKNNIELHYLEDNFDMYVSIAKYANNCLPIDIIQNDIFKEFRTKKKNFPKKFYYHF